MSTLKDKDDDIPILYYNIDESLSESNSIETKFYDNNTFIDWYSETMTIPSLINNSQFITKKWVTIIITAIISGYIVMIIDLSSVWLNDLRKGLCLSKIDKWSLLNPYLTCPIDDWYDWSQILFNSSKTLSSVLIDIPIYLILGIFLVLITIKISEKNLYIQQSGIPEVKEIIQGFNYDLTNYLGLKTLCFKILGLIFMVSSGFWLGKEGPLVHVSCCIMNVLYNLIFKDSTNEAVRRELLSAATATGISLAFNSPIGGVLFVLECIPSYFLPTKIMWNSFISATVSLVILVGIKQYTEGDNFNEHNMFLVEFGNVSWFIIELFPFIGIGILGAFYGQFFIKLYIKFLSNNFRSNVQKRLCKIFHVNESLGNYVEILLIFLVTALLNYPFTITRLPLNALLQMLFVNCQKQLNDSNSTNFICSPSEFKTLLKLLYIAIQAFFLSAYTFGTILPGGVLMPSLVIGATVGRSIGIIASWVQNSLFGNFETCTTNSCLVSPSAYAVIGAGSFMTSITKLTMCVVVILFELTGAVSYVLPIMIGIMVLKFVNDYLCNENIYDAWLKFNFNQSQGPDYNKGKGNGLCNYSISTSITRNKLPNVLVSKVMVPKHQTKCIYLNPDHLMTLQQLYLFLIEDNHEGYPILLDESSSICLGYIRKQKIYQSLTGINISDNTLVQFQTIDSSIQYQNEAVFKLDLEPDKQFIIMNEQTSIRLLIDVFEKMYLNYLIIYDSTSQVPNVMIGFIDRFIIGKLLDEGFESINDEWLNERFPLNDLETGDGAELSLLSERERHSIELIT